MIKSILGGKSKNLCDVAYLLTLPLDKNFERYGFLEVEIRVEPNTVCTFSRENANQINVGGATYLGITNQHGIPNGGSPNQWLNHETLPGLCHQNVQITAGAEGKLWIFFSANMYKKWQNHGNPFGYLQLEKGSTATEYVPHELTSYKSIMKVSDGHFVTSFDERMPCKTKNLINAQQNIPISQHMDVTIWQGEVNYVCTFSYELSMLEPNTGMAALFEFAYSDGTYSYIVSRDKYRVLSQITDSKKLTKIRLINWSDIKGIISNIQLEKGTKATDYVPYGYV